MIAVAGLLFAPHKANAVEGLSAGISGGPYYQRTRMPGPQSESVTLKEHGWVIAPKVSYEIQNGGGPQFAVEFEPQVLLSQNIKHNHPGFLTDITFTGAAEAQALVDGITAVYNNEVHGQYDNMSLASSPWFHSGLLCNVADIVRNGVNNITDANTCRPPAPFLTDNRRTDSRPDTEKYLFNPITNGSTVREWVARTALQNTLMPLPVPPANTDRGRDGSTPVTDASTSGQLYAWWYYYRNGPARESMYDLRRNLFNAYLAAVNDIPNQGGGDLSHITGDLNQWRLHMLTDLARRFDHFARTYDPAAPSHLLPSVFDDSQEELGDTVEAFLAAYAKGTAAERNGLLNTMRAVNAGDVSQLGQIIESAEISAMTHVILPVWFTVSKIAANGKLGGHLGVGTGVMLYNLGDRSPTVTDGVSWVGLAKAGFSGQFGGGIRVTWEARLHQALSKPENIDDVWGVSGTAGITVPFSLSF